MLILISIDRRFFGFEQLGPAWAPFPADITQTTQTNPGPNPIVSYCLELRSRSQDLPPRGYLLDLDSDGPIGP